MSREPRWRPCAPRSAPPKKRKRREKRMSDAKSGQHHQFDFKELKDIETLASSA
jgi:hypothetical protein